MTKQQHGHIKDDDMKEIDSLLSTSKDLKSIIVLHHPPIKLMSQWVDNIGLINGEEFIQMIKKHLNLKLVLFGHAHQEVCKNIDHIQIYGTPSTCYQFKPKTEFMEYDNLPPGFRLVKVSTNGTITTNVFRI